MHVWSQINGIQKAKDKHEYSVFTRLCCCTKMQKITIKFEDYTGDITKICNLLLHT